MQIRTILLFILPLFILLMTRCTGHKELFGKYGSNYADLGFFRTTLELKKDSTFNYHFGGDLISFTDSGHYSMRDRDIVLTFYPYHLDTSVVSQLSGANTAYRPKKFYFKNGKVYHYHVDGYVVKRGRFYLPRKFPLFFSKNHWVKRPYYLKKIKDQSE